MIFKDTDSTAPQLLLRFLSICSYLLLIFERQSGKSCGSHFYCFSMFYLHKLTARTYLRTVPSAFWIWIIPISCNVCEPIQYNTNLTLLHNLNVCCRYLLLHCLALIMLINVHCIRIGDGDFIFGYICMKCTILSVYSLRWLHPVVLNENSWK